MLTLQVVISLLLYYIAPQTAAQVYRENVDSVVLVEPYMAPKLEMTLGKITIRASLPWAHKYGHGTGVLLTKQGHILTAAHVAKVSGIFFITLKGGQTYEAGVLGIDSNSDLAILQPVRLSARGGKNTKIGRAPSIGDTVIHIGHPLSFRWVLTQGVVSGFGDKFLFSDTVANPGSSGGPLYDIHGKLVGITSAIASTGFGPAAYIGHSLFVGTDAIRLFLKRWNI